MNSENIRKNGKILHIVNIPWYSGLAGYALDMARYLKELGYENIFAVVGSSAIYNRIFGSYEVIALQGRGPLDSIKGFAALLKHNSGIDLVIAHTGSSFFMGALMGLLRNIPVWRVRAEKGNVKKNIFNAVMHRQAANIIIPMESIRHEFAGIVKDDKKIFLLPPVVDTVKFGKSELPAGTDIAVVGRLDSVKGHRTLIRSLVTVKKEIAGIRVLFSGKEAGVKWKDLEKYAADLGVRESISCLGYLDDEKLSGLMKSCRIGIVPSTGSEAVSRVALEWMACARPVIASNVGSLPETVSEGVNGFLIEPGDHETMAERITWVLKNRNLNAKMGLKSREIIENRFSPVVYKEKLKKLLASLNE
ncbi:MAG: glycosyltransferase family 4 protein [Elusimicrobiota bacterium]